MDGVATTILASFTDLNAELLLIIPGAVGVAAILWGAPKAVGFFKRVAK